MRKIMTALMVWVTLTTSGCASLSERAQDAMAAGNYEAAARYYEQALARKPDDPVAADGLRQARVEILGQKLLQVRAMRMAGNPAGALDALRNVVDLQGQWKVSPGGKVAFTQEEELGYAKSYFVTRIEADLSTQYPLRAAASLRKYERLFEPAFIVALEKKVNQLGRQSCQAFKKEVVPGKPFFVHFVTSYCRYWGDTGRVGSGKEALSDLLFGRMEIKQEGGFPGSGFLSAELTRALAKSAWYHPDGKRMAQASLQVDYQQKRDKQGLVLMQPYSEQEAYVENVVVRKVRKVEYTEMVVTVDPVTKQPRETLVKKYRDEPYETVEPQKKYRTVEKQYRYPAWKHTQSLNLRISAQFQFDVRTFQVALSEKSEAEGIEHDENQPSYHLSPQKPALPDPVRFSEEQSVRFTKDFLDQANRLWADSYCRMDSDIDSFAESGNRVELCLRGKPVTPPKFAEDWYRKFLGMGYAEAKALLGQ